mgnify:FL=1
MGKSKMYCCCKTNKIKTYQHLAVAIRHNNRDWIPANSNMAENDILIPYRTPQQAEQDIKKYLPRKNAVLAIEYVLIASPEFFERASPEEVAAWKQESLRFLVEKHGKENIVGCIVHQDETTYHIQAIVIPDDHGRLNCRHFLGGAKKMRELQDEYAAYMKSFRLYRGESKLTPGAKEEKVYYQTVNKGKAYATNAKPVKPEQLPQPTLIDRVDPRKYAAKLVNRAIAYMKTREGYLRAGLEAAEKDKEKIAQLAQKERQRWKEMKENPNIISELQEELKIAIEEKKKNKEDYEMLCKAIKIFFRRNIGKHDSMRLPEKLGMLTSFPELSKDIKFSLVPDLKPCQNFERSR